MNKYVFIIYSHKLKINHCLNMAEKYKDINAKIYIVVGDENIDNEYIIKDNIIILKCDDSYDCLTYKTLKLFKVIELIESNITGLFKCDDDIILNIDRFNTFLKLLNNDIHYSGCKIKMVASNNILHKTNELKKYNTKKLYKYFEITTIGLSLYCAGPLYYISLYAIKKFNNLSYIEKFIAEDVTVGYNLNKLNIYPIDYNLYTDSLILYYNINNIIAYHNIKRIGNIQNNNIINDKKNFVLMKNIGNNGRLGNQIYQFLFLLHISIEFNFNINLNYTNSFEIFEVFHNINIININIKDDYTVSYKENILYDDYNNVKKFINKNKEKNIDFNGYFQLSNYNNLISILTFKLEIQNYCNNYILNITENYKYNILCIHIRLGDYINNDFNKIYNNVLHWNNLNNIYINIINYLINIIKNKNFKILVFSDNINICKNIIKIPNILFYDFPNKFKHQELYIMSSCDYFILSNSTYGLWAYNLCKSDKKIVFHPNEYFYYKHPMSKYNKIIIEKLYYNKNTYLTYLFTTRDNLKINNIRYFINNLKDSQYVNKRINNNYTFKLNL